MCLFQGKCLAEGVDEQQLKDDVQRLVEGPSEERQKHYVLAALSDVHTLFTSSKTKSKGENCLFWFSIDSVGVQNYLTL